MRGSRRAKDTKELNNQWKAAAPDTLGFCLGYPRKADAIWPLFIGWWRQNILKAALVFSLCHIELDLLIFRSTTNLV
jgi:hypothetical protein